VAYITGTDLMRQYGADLIKQLADRDGSGSADTDVIDSAIAQADASIDGYLRAYYAVPLASPPEEIKAASLAIAFYKLWTSERPANVRQDYEDARVYLRDLSTGKASLSDSTITTASDAAGSSDRTSDDRVFSMDTLTDF